VDRIGGLVTVTTTAEAFKDNAAVVYRPGGHSYQGMAYVDVDGRSGDVQVFRDYRTRVARRRSTKPD
jgi:hypothetical protein